MEYLFEKYVNHGDNKVFIGYKRVKASNAQEAKEIALEKEAEGVVMLPITDPANF